MPQRTETRSRPHGKRYSLTSLGWDSRTRIDRSSVELSRGATWTVARVWSTAGHLHGTRLRSTTHRILLGVDGEAEVVVDGVPLVLAPRELLVIPPPATVETRSRTLWARCEWHVDSTALDGLHLARHSRTTLALLPRDYALLTTMTNVISTAPAFGTSPGSRILLDALSSTVAAAILDATDTPTSLSPGQADLVARAITLIEQRHTDPTFTITRLAQEMSLTREHLHHLFARTESPPRQVLEARRTRTARSLLSLAPERGKGTLEEIAIASGFTTVRTMKAALARQGDPYDRSPSRRHP
ncbi:MULTISPECIES: hypothetical protein [Bacteria]|uniref:hypothetical protein n=1 Tax=Bacteria TaxID=2 RepID=UPI003C7E955D